MKIYHVNLGGARSQIDGIQNTISSISSLQSSESNDVSIFNASLFGISKLSPNVINLIVEISRKSPDVVHFHSVYRPAHFLIIIWCLLRKVAFVISPHSGSPASKFSH